MAYFASRPLSLVLLRLASPAATIVLRLAFLLPRVLAICGVLLLLRSPNLLAFA
jgi:hypothetical protein